MESTEKMNLPPRHRGHGVSEMNLGIVIAARVFLDLVRVIFLAEPLRVVGRSVEMLTGFIEFILTFGRRLSRPTE